MEESEGESNDHSGSGRKAKAVCQTAEEGVRASDTWAHSVDVPIRPEHPPGVCLLHDSWTLPVPKP